MERPLAHLYETGGMRRVHLRGHTNIRKRLLIHASASNLGLLMRQLIGVGTPRGLQGRLVAALSAFMALMRAFWLSVTGHWPAPAVVLNAGVSLDRAIRPRIRRRERTAFTTGC